MGDLFRLVQCLRDRALAVSSSVGLPYGIVHNVHPWYGLSRVQAARTDAAVQPRPSLGGLQHAPALPQAPLEGSQESTGAENTQ